jgi:hypothetical protein
MTTPSRLSPHKLWQHADCETGGDPDKRSARYRELMIEHGHLVKITVPECAACEGDECADLVCPKSQRPCGHHCNCVMIHDHCHWCDTWWGEEGREFSSFEAAVADAERAS